MRIIETLISYLFELPIEKIKSRYSGEVEVSINKGQYKLSTSNAIYSFGKHYTSFAKAFTSLDIYQREIQSVLVLGFGLGSVVNLLEKHPSVQRITAVDIDDVIMQLAKKYLVTDLKNKIEFNCSDAERFVLNNNTQYDLVLFDVFIDDLTPLQFMQQSFLEQLKTLIAPHGMIIYSKIDDSHKSRVENAQFSQKFSTVFPNSFTVETNGNKLFVWENKQTNA